MNRKLSFPGLLWALALLASSWRAQAQWVTQSIDLKAGWNAVYLHVDASHTTLEDLIVGGPANPIQEVWLWAPPATTVQFIDSPQQPTSGGSLWLNWKRSASISANTLSRLTPNAAYLVRVDDSSPTYTWSLKGKPIPPRYQWTTTGLNFLGFPTPPADPPTFETLLAAVPDVKRAAEIFHYPGGELGAGNPARLFALRTQPVKRGQAFWIRSGGVFNRYFGPIELDLSTPAGVNFRDNLSQTRILLRNIQPAALTVTLALVNSEAPPAGQTAIVQAPPLLIRGALNTTNLTYGFSNLVSTPQTWSLAPQGQPGSEVEVVLGLNRSQMTGNPGDLFAGVLRFTDSLGLSQIDVGVSAQMGGTTGLWVGEAQVSQVQHYLKAYQNDAQGKTIVNSNGQYIAVSTNSSLGAVPRAFPLRLIVHSSTNVGTVLLQRVYSGLDASTNTIVSTSQDSLATDSIASARRISSVHLPWSAANAPWTLTGNLQQGGTLNATVDLNHDDQASSPFLHSYHPDHDNKDATFTQVLPSGVESYRVRRQIQMDITPPANNFSSLTTGNQTLSGVYHETVTFFGQGTEQRKFEVQGVFALTRLNNVAKLTTP